MVVVVLLVLALIPGLAVDFLVVVVDLVVPAGAVMLLDLLVVVVDLTVAGTCEVLVVVIFDELLLMVLVTGVV